MGKIPKETDMTRFRTKAILLLAMAVLCFVPGSTRASEEADVRAVVQQVFQQLQSRDFGAVYDSLPSSWRTRMSREGFIKALKRSQDRYALDRISIGAVSVSGNIAVADTELYGRVNSPFPAEGKIVVQQYLVREAGKWRVATGDTGTINRFLKTNPGFGRKFPIRQPKLFVKQGERWIEFNPKG